MKTIRENIHTEQISTLFSREEVANILFESIPLPSRLPGSPVLRIDLNVDGEMQIILTQSHSTSDVMK